MKRTTVWRHVARTAFGVVVVLGLAAWATWPLAAELVVVHETVLKLVSFVIGPLFALITFFWGRIDKAEMRELAEDLGQARAKAENSKIEADRARRDVEAKVARVRSLERDLEAITDTRRLWQIRKNDPFPDYRGWKHDPRGAKVVTIGLFKGGVGKTHLAANFAAYISETQRQPVLLIDLDYQGSLSTAMLLAGGISPSGSRVDVLFDENAGLATLNQNRVHLAAQGVATALNGGEGLSRAWLVPADYTLAEVESKLLVDRVIRDKATRIDERYRLAHVLLHPDVRREYAMIVIDTPPRMTLGTVNALIASHGYVVPTILDRVSSEALRPFLTQIESLKKDLDIDLRCRGIVGTLTRQLPLGPNEENFRAQIVATAADILGREDLLLAQNLPNKTQVRDSDDLGYFLSDGQGPLRDRFYDAIFNELWARIMSPPESR